MYVGIDGRCVTWVEPTDESWGGVVLIGVGVRLTGEGEGVESLD